MELARALARELERELAPVPSLVHRAAVVVLAPWVEVAAWRQLRWAS